jgi:hypothetical protein
MPTIKEATRTWRKNDQMSIEIRAGSSCLCIHPAQPALCVRRTFFAKSAPLSRVVKNDSDRVPLAGAKAADATVINASRVRAASQSRV